MVLARDTPELNQSRVLVTRESIERAGQQPAVK